MKNHYSEKQKQSTLNTAEPIRVMHVIDKLSVSGSGVHGITRAIEWWIPRFDPQQFQFTVCSLRAPELAGELLRQKGIPVVFLNKGKFDPSTLTRLIALIKRKRIHVLHLHGYGATNFGRLASLLTGIPNIVHEHAILPDPPLYQRLADTLLSPLTTRAIAVSKPVRDFMCRVRQENPKKLETLIIGVPLAEFQAPDAKTVLETRTQLGITPEEQVVCTVGRLDTPKGHTYLLKAAVAILKELPQTRFLIVGDGPELSQLKAVSQQEGVAERIIFTGLRQDVPALLALSDVAAIPSINEGGPLTLLEAMNLQKPVVGTPVGFMGDVIQDGETGFLVPCKSVKQLADKLIFLLKNQQLAQKMGERAWQICQNYDISSSQQRLSEIYRELAA